MPCSNRFGLRPRGCWRWGSVFFDAQQELSATLRGISQLNSAVVRRQCVDRPVGDAKRVNDGRLSVRRGSLAAESSREKRRSGCRPIHLLTLWQIARYDYLPSARTGASYERLVGPMERRTNAQRSAGMLIGLGSPNIDLASGGHQGT